MKLIWRGKLRPMASFQGPAPAYRGGEPTGLRRPSTGWYDGIRTRPLASMATAGPTSRLCSTAVPGPVCYSHKSPRAVRPVWVLGHGVHQDWRFPWWIYSAPSLLCSQQRLLERCAN